MKNLAIIELAPSEGLRGVGPLGNPKGTGITNFIDFISTAIGLMTIIAIIWFVFILITGAIGIIASGGDKAAMENARHRITSGIIGLVVVIAAVFIIDLVGTIFGIEFLNLFTLFYNLIPGGGPGSYTGP